MGICEVMAKSVLVNKLLCKYLGKELKYYNYARLKLFATLL